MKITVIDAEKAEPAHLQACLKHLQRWSNCDEARIIVNERVPLSAEPYKNPGWLEYGLCIETAVGPLYIGAIQRRPGEPVEFHS